MGLTLTRASTVVFAELAWTPSEVLQAEDRAHRIGQTHCVSVQLLLVKDSIDELMWEMLQSKLATTGQVLDGQAERMEVRCPRHPRNTTQAVCSVAMARCHSQVMLLQPLLPRWRCPGGPHEHRAPAWQQPGRGGRWAVAGCCRCC